jgi:acetolactate synthase-1/2/3 large subunit
VVALGGSVATSQNLKQIHQTLQAVSVLKPVTKFSAEASSPASIAEVMANAFRAAESGRPGAAFVNLPMDIMQGEAECDVLDVPASPMFGPGSRESLGQAADIINGAKRPVILLGLLASKPENAAAVRAFLRNSRGTAASPQSGRFKLLERSRAICSKASRDERDSWRTRPGMSFFQPRT